MNKHHKDFVNLSEGIVIIRKWMILKSGEECKMESCDFRCGCSGAEKGRVGKFTCHYGKLVRNYRNLRKSSLNK